jgi:hypothetical protein
MKKLLTLRWFLIACVLLFAPAACKKTPEKEGPAEQAGKQIDQSMEKAGQEVGKALESAGDAMKDAGQEVQKETKN